MPTYNSASFIAEAIDSVLAQAYDKLELIVVDNYSTDETERIVKSYRDSRIRYCKYENHGIIASGRNYGAGKANGELIAFIDSDDIWRPEKLSTQTKYLSEGVSCVSTDIDPIGEVKYFRRHLTFRKDDSYRDFTCRDVAFANPVVTSSALIRRVDFLAQGGFDENPDFRFIEDWELWLRLASTGTIRVLSNPLTIYRVAKKTNRDVVDVNKRTLRIFDKHRSNRIINDTEYARAVGACHVRIGKACLDVDDRTGIHHYFIGLRSAPGMGNRIKCAAGLILFCLPRKLKRYILDLAYKAQSQCRNSHLSAVN